MSDGFMLYLDDDGVARRYDDTYDITIHCESDKARMNADDDIHDYALSFLLIAMGEHLPKTLWSASDYSVLYGIIMDDGDELHIRDDQ